MALESPEPCKRIKLSSENDAVVAEDLSAYARLSSFDGFTFKRILSENSKSKTVCIEGFHEATKETAVIIIEKLPVVKENVNKLLNNADLALNLKAKSLDSNVINYACYPKVDRGDMKTTIICPATQKHIEKYMSQLFCSVIETPEIYRSIVLPHLQSQKFSIEWVYNILEHKSEAERIIFEDPDGQNGFILLPDLKWDELEKGSLYLIAVCHRRDIKSLRDLNASHLPLLENIKSKGLETISNKYSLTSDQLRIYIHYQPSYYHFHIHFTSIQKSMPGSQFEKAHLLNTVISNIKLCPTYYQEATLVYSLKENDPLFIKLKDSFV